RDARITTIYEGTTAIQSNDLIGRKTIRNAGATAQGVFEQIDVTTDALRALRHPLAERTADRLARATEPARPATPERRRGAAHPRNAYAVSVPYLMLLSPLTGGWMHALAIDAVLGRGQERDGDAARLTAADFYGAHHLPRVHALA